MRKSRDLGHHINEVHRLLLERFGSSGNLSNKENPLDELFFILLSGQTNNYSFESAFESLKGRFPDRNQLLSARRSTVKTTIEIAGLANQKGAYILAIAKRLKKDFGEVSLIGLTKLTTAEAEQYLCSLPGVGIKKQLGVC